MADRPREWHLASLVVRHRPDAVPALAAAIASGDGLELALQDDTRSVLLQESDGTAGLMDNIRLIESVPGVYAVNLVYHHIEPQAPATADDAASATAAQESLR
ncbi:chaperone NapD [Luteimonas sp. SDU101]|uniref:chaperone NapD n=1 Tax=Luteimonas sp. SDU101 TaxID=3422593 RepID=UPI003EB6DE11